MSQSYTSKSMRDQVHRMLREGGFPISVRPVAGQASPRSKHDRSVAVLVSADRPERETRDVVPTAFAIRVQLIRTWKKRRQVDPDTDDLGLLYGDVETIIKLLANLGGSKQDNWPCIEFDFLSHGEPVEGDSEHLIDITFTASAYWG